MNLHLQNDIRQIYIYIHIYVHIYENRQFDSLVLGSLTLAQITILNRLGAVAYINTHYSFLKKLESEQQCMLTKELHPNAFWGEAIKPGTERNGTERNRK